MDRKEIEESVRGVLDYFDGDMALARVMDLFDRALYVPGQYRCAICDFHKTEKAISMSTGQVGARVNVSPPVCSNGCGMMDKVTWKEWAEGQSKGTDRILAREDVLRVTVRELIKSLMETPDVARGRGMLMANVERVRTAMRAELSDDLVRIVYEYWQFLFDGASPKDLKVVEKDV